jgi:hypothetical protein
MKVQADARSCKIWRADARPCKIRHSFGAIHGVKAQ